MRRSGALQRLNVRLVAVFYTKIKQSFRTTFSIQLYITNVRVLQIIMAEKHDMFNSVH